MNAHPILRTELSRLNVDDDAVHAATENFDEFYRREFSAMRRLAYAIVGDGATADEVVQDAMTAVYVRWSRVRRYDKPGAFLRRVVVNKASNRRRKSRNERRALERVAAVADLVADDRSPSFAELVAGLTPRQTQCVALFYVEDLSIAAIADVLEIAEGTVRATLTQARAIVRLRIENEELR